MKNYRSLSVAFWLVVFTFSCYYLVVYDPPITPRQAEYGVRLLNADAGFGLTEEIKSADLEGMGQREYDRMLSQAFYLVRTSVLEESAGEGFQKTFDHYALFRIKSKFLLVREEGDCAEGTRAYAPTYFQRRIGKKLIMSFVVQAMRRATPKELGLPEKPSTCWPTKK